METYNARIIYVTADENTESLIREDFNTVSEATEWVSAKLVWIMMHWADINPYGVTVAAEVYNDDDTFSDLYELKCGL